MSDLFHARVSDEFIAEVWSVMARTPQHTYQILTKRPERMQRIIGDHFDGGQRLLEAVTDEDTARLFLDEPWPLPSVWLGTSIESPKYLYRIDALRQTSAAVRFLSLEPLLEPLGDLNLDGIHWVITGGESGPNARPMDSDWVRDIRDQCAAAGVAYFHKQNGGHTPKANGRLLDGRTWDEMPARGAA